MAIIAPVLSVIGRVILGVIGLGGSVVGALINPFEIIKTMVVQAYRWTIDTLLTPFRVFFAIAFFAVIIHFLFEYVLSIPLITENAQSFTALLGDFLPLVQYFMYLGGVDVWLPYIISFFFVRAVLARLTIPLH